MTKPVVTKHAMDRFREFIMDGPTNKIKGAMLRSIRTAAYIDSRAEKDGGRADYYLGSYFVRGGKNKSFVTVLRGGMIVSILEPDCKQLKDDVSEYKANIDRVRSGKSFNNKTLEDLKKKINRLERDNNKLNKVLTDKEAMIKHCECLGCKIIKLFGKKIIVM